MEGGPAWNFREDTGGSLTNTRWSRPGEGVGSGTVCSTSQNSRKLLNVEALV